MIEKIEIEKLVKAGIVQKLNVYNEYHSQETFYETWDVTLGKGHREFSYLKLENPVEIYEDKKEILEERIKGNEPLKVIAITGSGGSGKSRVSYEFFCKMKDDGWSCKGIHAEYLKKVNPQLMIRRKNFLLIIDYILPHTKDVGEWIKNLWREQSDKIRADGNRKDYGVIRIILVERAQVTKSLKPNWYKRLVESNNLYEICSYNDFIHLDELSKKEMIRFAKKYIEFHETDNKPFHLELYYAELVDKIPNNCRYPLFMHYICKAYQKDSEKNIRDWDRDSLLDYVNSIERKRIQDFSASKAVQKSLEKILAYMIALSNIRIDSAIPFLEKDFEILNNTLSNGWEAISDFSEINNHYILKPSMPDIVAENFVLEYLKSKSIEDRTCVKTFINNAWAKNALVFESFLCRVVEDFPDHELVNFDALLQQPQKMNDNQTLQYADLLREYTYWSEEPEKCDTEILNAFEKLLDCSNNKKVRAGIQIQYAKSLFNLIWSYCEFCENSENNVKKVVKLFELIDSIIHENSDGMIHQIKINATNKMFKKWKIRIRVSQ